MTNGLKTGFVDKLLSGFTDTWNTATRILGALKDIIFHFSLNKLGGPVAIYNASSQAAQLEFQQSCLLWPCSLLILGSSI